jgi:hypothetical protein
MELPHLGLVSDLCNNFRDRDFDSLMNLSTEPKCTNPVDKVYGVFLGLPQR